ncbi:PDGLE domain-containing protein [Janibacter cremeus]|uniref:PDGLE domain-containing protein n=1 Tax=Janibacter cremeus TaxID=1285192 RepID=A0A852VX19_9MICO|nr:PDGLE domain-containing protein [Janibacter cremeus]NYF99203.1 hypothetical protein [Janibacter cremeus]
MKSKISTRTVVLAGVAVAVLLAAVVSFYASGSPDGLERVAESLGFSTSASDHAADGSPLADYGVSGIANARLSSGLAGIIGLAAVGILMAALTRVLRRGDSDSTED